MLEGAGESGACESRGDKMEAHTPATVQFPPIAPQKEVLPGQSFVGDVVPRQETDGAPGPLQCAEEQRGKESSSTRFLYCAALIDGENPPCFYCGSRKHPTTRCPSKRLPYSACGLDALGRLGMDEVNRLFSAYLARAGGDLPADPEPLQTDGPYPVSLAPLSFYELKRVFQLRFVNLIWCASSKDDWHKVKERRRETSAKGGILWLARDCIRVSRLDEAEDFLRCYGRDNSRDYRTACGFGFVHIERGSYASAADFFTEALGLAVAPVQKTYLLLLLSRIYACDEDYNKALGALKEALRAEPYCLEARFEEIIRYFQSGRQSDAMSRLLKLLALSHEYWAAALISPELAEFQSSIAPEFRKLAVEACEEAHAASSKADRSIASLKSLLPDEDEGVAEAVFMQERMHELLEKPDALPACQEAVYTAKRIVADCAAVEKERKDAAAAMLLKLEARVGMLLGEGPGRAKLAPLVRSILVRLRAFEEGLERREPLGRSLKQCEALSVELESIEAAAKRLKERAEILLGCGGFFKDLTIVLLITAAAGLVAFPAIVFCVDAFQPGFMPAQPAELWFAQKTVFVVGGLFAAMFALGRSIIGRTKGVKK